MKFSFSHRIMMSFIIIASLSVLVGYFAFSTTRNLQRVSTAIMKENVSSLKAAEELELTLLNQKGFVSSYFLDGNTIWLSTLEEKKRDFDAWFKKAHEVALTENEKIILQDILALYEVYDRQRNNAIGLYQAGRFQEAKEVLLGDVKSSVDYLYQKCEDLILANEVLIANAEVSSQRNVLRMKGLIWATIFGTLSLGAFMGFFIARKVNEQLLRSTKMATLGQLSANVAHEIRNPLTSIKMRLYSLQEELKDAPSAVEDINVISEEIDRMEGTVKTFLDFARPPELRLQRCDINKIVEGAISLIAPKAKYQNIEIKKMPNLGPIELDIDGEQMRQVFLNVFLNAVEAMSAGGALDVSMERKENRQSKDTLEIKVRDTGPGIPTDLQKRIFEPFFTTKSEGTGLGLFIASRIVQSHRGDLEIESEPGKGTILTVKLPLAA